MRNVLAALLLGLLLWYRRGFGNILPDREERSAACLVGILQIGVMTGGTTLAMQYIDASRTVLIAYSMPLWSAVLSFLYLNERASRSMLMALCLGSTGMAVLVAPWSRDWSSPGPMLGSGIALLATLGWASGSILHRSRTWRSDLWQLVFVQLLAGAVFSLVAAVLFEVHTTSFTPTFVAIAICSPIGPSILGFWFWARALRQLSVTTASQALLLSPRHVQL
ncbi:DMT family transporter [Aureimonas populi]|uniref:DMT family transporter n=1 Tax=Aureimonas populi TaxID=1701758 RepID=A0ABW5CQ58_9HYPH|nr:DMT family transporter [Aureimonas populi]